MKLKAIPRLPWLHSTKSGREPDRTRGFKKYHNYIAYPATALVIFIAAIVSWWIMIKVPGKSFNGPLPPLTKEEMRLRGEIKAVVDKLGQEIGERNVFRPRALDAAVHYLEDCLTAAGYQMEHQEYEAEDELCHNLITEIPGSEHPGEILLIGAHYDSVYGSPGANDNGTGVAAVITLARMFSGRNPPRTLRFALFVNEEPPFFQTARMGSLLYAKRCRERNENIIAVLIPETIGCYRDEPGSQDYPFPLSFFYPDRGNFITFVGDTSSRRLVCRAVESFRRQVKFPSEGAALPALIPGVGWSDHWAFWQAGYPAIMVTDTAPYRYPFYHTGQDTPDKIDYDRTARVVFGLGKIIDDLIHNGI